MQDMMSLAQNQNYPNATLYVLATPIGNLADISLRALHVLNLADAIACEDTRNTGQLLSKYGLQKHLIAAHQHNEYEVADKIIQRLQVGERIALVSDAGTPAISDPGAIIVDKVRQSGFNIVPIPGACAGISALSVSGFYSTQFQFVGFLPTKTQQREHALQQLVSQKSNLILYEAPHRIEECIAAIHQIFEAERRILFAREISKLFEEIHRCTIGEALTWVKADKLREKGEYVIVIEAKAMSDNIQVHHVPAETEKILKILMAELPIKQASQLTASITGEKKNKLYDFALSLKKNTE